MTGQDFQQNKIYYVKFTSGKYEKEETATTISETELKVKTPNFQSLGAGPKEAEVFVRQERGDFTITSTKFRFFLNTRPENTIVFGPGVLSIGSTKEKISFSIQARNMNNENRDSGRDDIQIEITQSVPKDPIPEDPEEDPIEYISVEDVQIEDMNSGQYVVTYKAPEGTEEDPLVNLNLNVKVKNEKNEMESIKGMPIKIVLSDNNPVEANDPNGGAMLNYIND